MIGDEKIVNFARYCKRCKHRTVEEYEDPCNDCLNNPVNIDSHKPVNFEEKEND